MANKKKKFTLSLVECGFFAALTAVLSLISIPLPSSVPITLQTFAVPACGYTLGAKKGTAAVLVYLALGALGLPVFSGFQSGIGTLLGPTGGFLMSFPFVAFICGLGSGKPFLKSIKYSAAALLVDHTAGVLWYSFAMKTDILSAFLLVSLPFILKDALFLAASARFSLICKAKLKKIG